MAHEIDLKNYKIRTDIIVDTFDKNTENKGICHTTINIGDIVVDDVVIDKIGEKTCNKSPGNYKTITFKDITDKDNYKKVEEVVINNLRSILKSNGIKDNDTCLIIGLGNPKSTPDSLGPKVIDNILVTRYLFELGEVEEGYRNTSSFVPNVTGVTGIETRDLINGIVKTVKPDFLIVIDALASSKIDRVNKTIQITDAGILPGSGVGNNREILNKDTFKIPVIAIGVPTIVDALTIVYDTFNYMKKKFSYNIDNVDSNKLKFVDSMHQNYLDTERELTKEEEEKILGMVGTLNDDEFKKLILEVLSPINYNLMVTPKEIDFVIDKLGLLIGNSINKVLHNSYNTTN